MEIPKETADKILKKINAAKNICVISHRNPDADTVGSNIAMRLFLGSKGKKVTSACIDNPEFEYDFITNEDETPGKKNPTFVQEINIKDFDLFISVDASSQEQTGFKEKYPSIFKKTNFINIDHHATNKMFGAINLVMPNSASTTLIIFNLFKEWEAKIGSDIATCILLGLYSDTGSFMHSNAEAETFSAAAELMTLGAKQQLIIKKLYKSQSIGKLRLLGKILCEAQMTKKNIIVSAIKDEDFAETNTSQSDLTGIIDYINMAKGNKIAALLSEDGKGNVKGSLRTKSNDLNMSEIAETLGGGGHKKASGFTIKGHLRKVVHWSIE
jgi:phosphoesterase RecJ-like protein